MTSDQKYSIPYQHARLRLSCLTWNILVTLVWRVKKNFARSQVETLKLPEKKEKIPRVKRQVCSL